MPKSNSFNARAIGLSLTWEAAFAFAGVPILLGFVGAVVPSQLGIQEGAQALVATALGIPAPTAVANGRTAP